jgi:SAM-dependent methyltransferase
VTNSRDVADNFVDRRQLSEPSIGRETFTRRLARWTIPKALRRRLGRLGEWLVPFAPDRIYLKRVILPQIARRGIVLLVGCRRYTAHDPIYLERRGVVCWTLDIDPAVARWGAPRHHLIAPIEDAASHFAPATFDTVVLNGVLGYGVDDADAQEAAVLACAAVLKPGGLLVLGWNSDLVADPSRLTGITRNFDTSSDAELRGRVTFRRSTHVFDFHTRRAWVGAVTFMWAGLQPLCNLLACNLLA